MKTASLQEILRIREFNKNFSNSLYKMGHEIFEKREKQLYALGYKMSEDGEYYINGNLKISSRLLNFNFLKDKYWNEMLLRRSK